MNPTYQPTNWIDLIPYILVAIPSLAAALLGVKTFKQSRVQHSENKSQIKELQYEITNDHKSHIRHDIDAIHALVSDGFNQLRHDISAVRHDLRAERRERIEADRLINLLKEGDER